MASQAAHPGTPALFTQPPPIRDPLVTETTDLQDATLSKCLPFLKGISDLQKGPFNPCGVPALQRDDHVEYLYDSLEDYPAGFVAMDSSRPWMIYWGLAGLTLLGEDVSRVHQRCVISFFFSFGSSSPCLLFCSFA
jgi:protein farnesyltransferase subunit beta